MNSLDANVVLRYILQDIPDQAEIAGEMINNSVCYVSDVIFTEVAFVLHRHLRMPRQDVGTLLKCFAQLPTVVCSEALLIEVADLFVRVPRLSFADCYAAVESKLNSDRFITFDKDLAKFGGKHVIVPERQ